eukprot:5702011-Pleurochrysis_carterae.AAC.1
MMPAILHALPFAFVHAGSCHVCLLPFDRLRHPIRLCGAFVAQATTCAPTASCPSLAAANAAVSQPCCAVASKPCLGGAPEPQQRE